MRINGLGCSLVDNLYSPVNFRSESYKKWSEGDNRKTGIITGGLIFGEDLERSSGKKYKDILNEITGGELFPDKNIGGPAIVSLIHISQMIGSDVRIKFFGARSDDDNGRYIAEKLKTFNIDLSGYLEVQGQTPFTDVLADPSYYDNNGERSFINYIGAAGKISSKDLSDSFFDADILIYGGTALTPGLHDDLSILLKKGKESGALNFVNTVYDFRNQKLNPNNPWPLVSDDNDFKNIDLFIADNQEALKISGMQSKEQALGFFADKGVHSILITHGAEEVICYSDGLFFREKGVFSMPVSQSAGTKMKALVSDSAADTTGCGDNFAGGVYASSVLQMLNTGTNKPFLKHAVAWGVVSGGFAGLYRGGVYYEEKSGDKLEKLKILFREYNRQVGEELE